MASSTRKPDAAATGVAAAEPVSVRSELEDDAERVDGVGTERGDERRNAVRRRMEWAAAEDTLGSAEGIRHRVGGRGQAVDGTQSAEDAAGSGVGQRAADWDSDKLDPLRTGGAAVGRHKMGEEVAAAHSHRLRVRELLYLSMKIDPLLEEDTMADRPLAVMAGSAAHGLVVLMPVDCLSAAL